MALRSLGTLTLDLVAKIGGFTGPLDKASRESLKRSKEVAAQWAKTGAAIGAGIAAGAAAIAAATIKVTNDLSRLKDEAAVAAIGVETFQAWGFAAEQAGVSTDKFESAMRRANKTIGDAIQGNDSARKIFADLGVAVLDVNGDVRSTEAVVRDFSDALAALPSDAQRASAAAALFGREAGPRLAVLLAEGNQGLEDMEARARELGLVLDKQTIDAAEQFGDELDTIRRILSTGLAAGLAQLIPTLSSIARAAIEATPAMVEFADKVANLFVETEKGKLRDQIDALGDQVDEAAHALNELRDRSLLGNMLHEGPVTALLFGDEIEQHNREEIQRLESMLRERRVLLERAREELRDLMAPPNVRAAADTPPPGQVLQPDGDVDAAAKKHAKAIRDIESAARAANDALEDARIARGAFLADLDNQAKQVAEELMTEEEAIQASYERRRQIILNSTMYAGEAQTELLRRLEEKRAEDLLELNGSFWERYLASAEENLLTLDELTADLLSNVSQQFGDAFEAMIFDAESLEDAVRGMAESILRSVVNAIGQMVAQWLALQAVQLLIGQSSQAAAVAGAAASGTAMASAYAPAAAMASLASFGANAVPAMAGIASTAAMAQGLALAGMAHDGIERVPKTGTWLLQEGERVVSSKTSAKLDAMLGRLDRGGTEVNVHNAPPGTRTVQRRGPDGRELVEVLIADLASDGPAARAMAGAYGLSRRGR
jgi:archaellum component FlaC